LFESRLLFDSVSVRTAHSAIQLTKVRPAFCITAPVILLGSAIRRRQLELSGLLPPATYVFVSVLPSVVILSDALTTTQAVSTAILPPG
jgi:hypothetical protein